MTAKEKMIVKLEEQLRIYKDSPTCNVTYIDLARLVEDFLEILQTKEIGGFNGK